MLELMKKLLKVKVALERNIFQMYNLQKIKPKTNVTFLQSKFVEKNKALWEGPPNPSTTKSL